MNISYLGANSGETSNWDAITRDERYFCFELFKNIKVNPSIFIDIINRGADELSRPEDSQKKRNILKSINPDELDIGVEVCFYRDLLKWNGLGVKNTPFPQKRTFDLALFTENAIIIIEAKAQQGFDNKQLEDFKRDEENIKAVFNELGKTAPTVILVGLTSSLYTPKKSSKESFISIITWKAMAEAYPDSKSLFSRANAIYKD